MKESFEPLELFLEICKIPHPSKNCSKLKEWIITKAKENGATIKEDKAGNLLCTKGNPKICLQGHYDMVYVGESKDFKVQPKFLDSKWLGALDSSLGADNGAALACMILALRDFDNIECLFTNDEEVGMIGANHLELEIHSPYIINCDSEDIDEVIYSCAGGYDLKAKKGFEILAIPKDYKCFEIKTQNFKGGHSGIEIHKNIPNAILELAKIARDLEGIIIEFWGGEKRNSIPVNATLKIALKDSQAIKLESLSENFVITPLKQTKYGYACKDLLTAILGLENGVIKAKGNSPLLSSNLGILKQDNQSFIFYAMGRGNQEDLMQKNIALSQTFLNSLNFEVNVLDYYAPWTKEEGRLLELVWDIYQKHNKNAELKSIHAGLECGILKQKFPKAEFISIGPTILHPHSLNEKLDLESFKKFWVILQEILQKNYNF